MLDGTQRRTTQGLRLFACALAACSVMLVLAGAADAAGFSYVALGDSYTSSPLTGGLATGVPALCLQSTNDYPHLVAAAIQATSLTDVSCSAAAIANMTEAQTNGLGLGTNPPQLDALTLSTTLVTIGISANDAGVFGIAVQCMVVDLLQPNGSACEDRYTVDGVNQITDTINQTAPRLAAAYQDIHALAPQARVLAVGYPAVFPVNGTSCWPLVPISPHDMSFLASLLVQLNKMIAATAAANDVQYVDTYTPTVGHDVCQPVGTAGFTALLPTSGLSAPMHPNAFGSALMAKAVLQAIDEPAGSAPSRSASVDLKVTQARIGRRLVTASGTISRAYHGRVAITFQAYYHHHPIDIHRSARVTRGRFRATLPTPLDHRHVPHAGTLIATSLAEQGLAAGAARAHIR